MVHICYKLNEDIYFQPINFYQISNNFSSLNCYIDGEKLKNTGFFYFTINQPNDYALLTPANSNFSASIVSSNQTNVNYNFTTEFLNLLTNKIIDESLEGRPSFLLKINLDDYNNVSGIYGRKNLIISFDVLSSKSNAESYIIFE